VLWSCLHCDTDAAGELPAALLQVEPLLLLVLFQLHLVRRTFETALLLPYKPGDVMHGVAYVFGLR
jgi:hypothetical protein